MPAAWAGCEHPGRAWHPLSQLNHRRASRGLQPCARDGVREGKCLLLHGVTTTGLSCLGTECPRAHPMAATGRCGLRQSLCSQAGAAGAVPCRDTCPLPTVPLRTECLCARGQEGHGQRQPDGFGAPVAGYQHTAVPDGPSRDLRSPAGRPLDRPGQGLLQRLLQWEPHRRAGA